MTFSHRTIRRLSLLLVLVGQGAATSGGVRAVTTPVLLLGGQSNMEGMGVVAEAPAAVRRQPPLRLFHSATLHSPEPADQLNVLGPAGHTPENFGPELSAAYRLREQLDGAEIFLVKHARGGSKLTPEPIGYKTDSWYPGANKQDTANWGIEFTRFVRTVEAALAALQAEGRSPRIIGMLWVQGEADATNAAAGAAYRENLTLLLRRVREQFDVPSMPFVYAQVLPYQRRTASAAVRQAMADMDQDSGSPHAVQGAFMVSTAGMGEQGDKVHFNTPGQLALGQALASTLARRALGASASGRTIAYWQLDESAPLTYLMDAVGEFHLDVAVGAQAGAALAPTLLHPDAATFLDASDPQLNSSGAVRPTGVRRAYDAELDMRNQPFTFEAFFKSDSVGDHTGYSVIAGTRSSLSKHHGWRIIMIEGKLRFFATNNAGRSAQVVTENRYDDGRTHHVAARWEPATGTLGRMSLYVDGALVGAADGVGDLGDANEFRKRFAIGADVAGTPDKPLAATRTWGGTLDELRMSRVVLSPEEFLIGGSEGAE